MAGHNRKADEIEADLAAARARMSANITELVNQVHPQIIKQRQIDQAKASAKSEFNYYKSQIVDENGLRLDRVVVLGSALAGAVTFLLVVRGIVSSNRKRRARKVVAKVSA